MGKSPDTHTTMTMMDSSKPDAGERDAMAPASSFWSDLNSELLVSIATLDSVSLRDYACLRGVCTAWRSVLAPMYPCLLSLLTDGYDRHRVSTFSLPMRRSFHLYTGSSTLVPNPTAAYAAPYDSVLPLMVTKGIFVCHGTLYQVWKNTSATVKLGGRNFRISAGEMFVLRYDPGRWSCWDAVKDLGGCSVFIGKNNSPAVVRPVDAIVPDVRANCVYWIDWKGVPMVCDIATGTSKQWVLPRGALEGDCWYFGHDDMTSINGDGRNMTS